MNTLLAAKTNWGKSYSAQAITEANAPEADCIVVLDYDDEYRGLHKYGVVADHHPIGPGEVGASPDIWQQYIEKHKRVRLPRYNLSSEEWREAIAPICRAVRNIDAYVFVLLDEADAAAPQKRATPEDVEDLATAGDDEGVSTVWCFQRPSLIDETIIAQGQSGYLGGFSGTGDLGKLESMIPYNSDVHNTLLPEDEIIDGLPEYLHHPDDGPVRVRRYTDGSGATIGSEWIYWSDARQERRDSRNYEMISPHVGGKGRHRVKRP